MRARIAVEACAGTHDDARRAELEPELVARARENPWFALKKRRPEAYGELTFLQ